MKSKLLKFILMMVLEKYCQGDKVKSEEIKYSELDEHTLVTDSEAFPFIAAILIKSTYLSAGALIANDWVITGGDALFMVRESARTIRVRLGSINYKKGGVLLPIKYIEIHPYFDDNSPAYDLALIKLPHPVELSACLWPIKLQKHMREADATHFTVTSWQSQNLHSDEDQLKSMEIIQRQRILSVTHLHPAEDEECNQELASFGIDHSNDLLCLDTEVMVDPCVREVGAPAIVNGILWGIVSSWRPANCENGVVGSSYVVLVSAPNVSQWIHGVVDENSWSRNRH